MLPPYCIIIIIPHQHKSPINTQHPSPSSLQSPLFLHSTPRSLIHHHITYTPITLHINSIVTFITLFPSSHTTYIIPHKHHRLSSYCVFYFVVLFITSVFFNYLKTLGFLPANVHYIKILLFPQ